MPAVPAIRIQKRNRQPIRAAGGYVLYWMISNRRVHFNFALDRALEHCAALKKPLLILEPLRVDYRWASDRLHRFVLDGMAVNARECREAAITYFPYVEPESGAGKGLLAALAEKACVIVTDEFPCFFLPHMVAAASQQVPVLLESVDSNGLLPIHATQHVALRAYDFRRYLQKELPKHLGEFPRPDPLRKSKFAQGAAIPAHIEKRWPAAPEKMLLGENHSLAALPIDHSVEPVALRGGHSAARALMIDFLERKLPLYHEERNEPELDATSGISPYLHFGHLSVHEVFLELARREKWKPQKLGLRADGNRDGWWNMSPAADNFLDQLITWRELGYNFAAHRTDYDQYESLPEWVKKTLAQRAKDERDHLYTLEEFEAAQTHDTLWNAAQRQLVQQGRIHNYLRMLWGKKILQWTRTPQQAAEIMIHLNDKYALDGRDPNSYSGIFWVLGRYDRPWAPERPVFGMIRYMSSKNTARKVSVKGYIQEYAPERVAQRSLLDTAPTATNKLDRVRKGKARA